MKWHINPTKLCIHNKLVSTESNDIGDGIKVIYSLNGKLHNPSDPALIHYYEDRAKTLKYSELYYVYGKAHNSNGPARKWWYMDGTVWAEDYVVNGNYHRTDGPASLTYDTNGKIVYKYYYENGVPLREKNFYKII